MRTEPFGLTGKSKRIGEMAVSKDVSLAYSSTGRTYNELRKISERKARAYGKAMEAGDHKAAERIIRSTLPDWQEVSPTDNGEHLERLRDSKGRVRSPQIVNLANDGAVSAIRAEKMQTAGTAKAGWVQAAEAIGSKSRFPSWLRKSGALGAARVLKRGWGTVVTLFNRVRYLSNVLPDSKLRAALRQTERNQIRRIETMLAKRRL